MRGEGERFHVGEAAVLTSRGEEARSAVSNHEATDGPASFETPLARLLRMRRLERQMRRLK
jgi:hypothetical protein